MRWMIGTSEASRGGMALVINARQAQRDARVNERERMGRGRMGGSRGVLIENVKSGE